MPDTNIMSPMRARLSEAGWQPNGHWPAMLGSLDRRDPSWRDWPRAVGGA